MLNDSDIVAALGQRLSAPACASLLGRLLRVPTVWTCLHEPETLARILDTESIEALQPGDILVSRVRPRRMTDDQLRDAAAGRIDGDGEVPSLERLSILRQTIIWSSQHGEPWAGRLGEDALWADALACAWPELTDSAALLRDAFTSGDASFQKAVANALLANVGPASAAAFMSESLGSALPDSISSLEQIGEHELAVELVALDARAERSAKDLHEVVAGAVSAQVKGEIEGGHLALQQAWDLAQEAAADVADHLADFAEAQHETVLSLEARQRALAAAPTPRRRAALAWSQTALGRADQALTILARNSDSLEEALARAGALLQAGDRGAASQVLADLGFGADRLAECSWAWLERARQIAVQLGSQRLAGHVSAEIVRRTPASATAWLHRARFLHSTGQPAKAVEAASVSLALDPGLAEAERVIASGLTATDRAQQALPMWKALAEREPKYLPDLADCALKAGQPEFAGQLAEQMLVDGGQPIEAGILQACAAAAMGDIDSARHQLHALVGKHPEHPGAWIALARLQSGSGEDSLAGATLASAVQTIPGEPELLMGYAAWLREHGRTTEATALAVKAVDSEQAPGDWLRQTAEWLRELGHHDQALPLLQRCADLLPHDGEVQNSLAGLLEQTGRSDEAYRRLRDIPFDTPGIDPLLAGRVGITAAQHSHESTAIAWAARHLAAAVEQGPPSPQADLWFARSQMLTGNPIAAAQHYMAAVAKSELGTEVHRQAALELADAAVEAEQPSMALDPLEALLSSDRSSLQTHDQLARVYAACEMWDKAVPLAEQAANLAPNDPDAQRRLGAIAASAGADHVAALAYGRLVQLEPADFEAWLALANTAAHLDRTAVQRQAVAHALAIGRDDPDRLLRISGILASLGEPALAMSALRRAHAIDPHTSAPLLALAQIAGLTGDREQARRAWSKLSALEPKNVEFLLAAGEAEHAAGRLREAIDLYRRATAEVPAQARTRLALARELWLSGDLTAAEAEYRKALMEFPQDPQVLVAAGQSFLARGRLAEARPAFEEALRRAPSDPQALQSLAECLLRSGEATELLGLLDSPSGDLLPLVPHACLRTLAQLQLNESDAASAAFSQATLPQDPGPSDVVWISRAAREIGAWDYVLRPDRVTTVAAEEELLEAMLGLLRLADAACLFAFVGVAGHAPRAAWLEINAWDQWTQLEGNLVQIPAYAERVTSLGRRADVYRVANDDERRSALRQALAQTPDISTAETLGVAFLRAGLPNEVVAALRMITPSASPWTELLQGMAHAGQGAPALALDCYHAADLSPALRPVASVLRARTFLQLGQEESAISEFNQALAAWPEEAAWHAELASAYADGADPQRALPHLQQAVALAPEVQDYHLAYARALVDAEQAASAVQEYRPVLESMPKVGGLWKEAGAAALAAGDLSLAQSWFDEACNLVPDDAKAWVGAALTAHRAGNAKRAAELGQTAARLAPADVQVQMAQAEIFAAAGKHDKALQAYEAALAGLEDPLPAHLGRLGVMCRIGRDAEAIAQIERLQDEHPDDERLWMALSRAREGSGDLVGAFAAAEKAVELAPRAPEARVALGRLARKQGQLDRAIDVLSNYSPSGPEAAIELGMAFEARREFGRALEQFQRAIALDPANAPAHFHAGAVLRSVKDYPQASRMFERAVELDPKDTDALHQLAAVRALELVHGAIPLQAVLG